MERQNPDCEREWIQAARRGDAQAFEQIVRHYSAQVLNLALRLCGRIEDAQDIHQLAFIKVYASLHGFRADANFSTWLFRIVVNVARDLARAETSHAGAVTRRAELDGRACRSQSPAPDLDDSGDWGPRVAHAIARLPQIEREALILRHYLGMSFTEVAEIVGAPLTTMQSRVLRALQSLRDELLPSTAPHAPR